MFSLTTGIDKAQTAQLTEIKWIDEAHVTQRILNPQFTETIFFLHMFFAFVCFYAYLITFLLCCLGALFTLATKDIYVILLLCRYGHGVIQALEKLHLYFGLLQVSFW